MDVGVRQRDPVPLDMDDQDVRLGQADVVLDHELVAGPGGRGAESRVVELEFLGPVDARHERPDQRSIPLVHTVDAGAVDRLGGDLLLESVQFLVKIHDQQVQTVVFGCCAEVIQAMEGPVIRSSTQEGHLGDQLLEPLLVP